MKLPSVILWAVLALSVSACTARHAINQATIKKKIQELNLINLNDKQIQVENVMYSGADEAVAQTNIQMTFQLSKSKETDWHVKSIRLGDRDWISVKDFQAALNEVRAQNTRNDLQKLRQAMEKYREKNGHYPRADNIVKLTDILFPAYMPEASRFDGWNRPFIVTAPDPPPWRISSSGPDGIPGNADDIVVEP